MPSTQEPDLTLLDLLRTLTRYKWRFLGAALVVASAAGVFAVYGKRNWEAAQAVMVRNEAATRVDAPGKFHHEDEMKTVQETILELALSRPVLEGALREVAPPADWKGSGAWPNEEAVEDLRRATKLAPPKGAEFGKTEVFYIKVKDPDQERALALVSAICTRLQAQFSELRHNTARAMLDELDGVVAHNERDLTAATEKLSTLERSVGPDIVALRMLHQSPNADTDLSRALGAAEAELRQLHLAQTVREGLLKQLRDVEGNPQHLLAAPRDLIEFQPALARLKQGMAEAQLKLATQSATYTVKHPLVIAAQREVEENRAQILKEAEAVSRGLKADAELAAARVALLEKQIGGLRGRMESLASVRAAYSNQSSQVEHLRTLLEQSQRHHADVHAAQAAARGNGLISRIGEPQTGTRPSGPGPRSIILAGLFGGFCVGAGLVFLTAPVVRKTPVLSREPVFRRENSSPSSAALVAAEASSPGRLLAARS